ncbi:phage tail protein [Bradyrhizobium sp. CCBAU 51753]|uniref:phage tail protein n=1 Tax=Bradyrhizobium sp. CCBAU 51753 TaxID=1325100 RepID=UPI001AEDE9B9|nr:phage tail protein [Bradyrhizobium sp. CCBAU 51753]
MIPLAMGNVRLAGQPIWDGGIEATATAGASSFVSMCCAYCEPIDVAEPIRIQRMWANSTLFYDYSAGGVITVANLSPEDQQALADCVSTMEFHAGGPGELPSPIMEEFLGAGNVPAYRGLRTIVFPNFPMAIANNAVPNISVEFRRTDTTLLNVSDCLNGVIAAALARRGYVGYQSVTGIDDQCYGVIVTSQGSVGDFLTSHKDIYNFQILDGDHIKIVRREVNSSLVIDFDVDEADLIRTNGSPTISFSRATPDQVPVGVNLTYPDFNRGFDLKPESALHEGTSASTLISSLSSSFVVDSTTARDLAFTILYTLRAKGLRLAYEMTDTRVEAGDTVQITTTSGDLYVTLVEKQTHTKNRTAQVQALNLLTATGVDVSGDSGSSGGSNTRLSWPADVMLADFVVDSERVYAAAEFPIYASVNSWPTPQLRIGSSKYKALDQSDVAGANWGRANYPVNMFEDDTYVYWLDHGYLCLSRLPKTATTITGIQTWTVPAGFYDGGASPHNVNTNTAGNYGFTFRNGKLYLPWMGGFNGSAFASSNDIKLVVLNIQMWGDQTSAAWELHDVYSFASGDTAYTAAGCVILDNDLVVIPATSGLVTGTKFWSSDVADLTVWSTNLSTFTLKNSETLISHGDVFYGAEENGSTGRAYEKHRIALWDFSSGFSETVVNLTDDPNVVAISQVRGWGWRSDTHFFVFCNHTNYNYFTDFPVRAPRRYIARRKLSDGSADGGAFVDEIIWNGFDFYGFRGRYFNGKNYIHWDAFARNHTRLTEISESLDPSTAVHWWPKQTATPTNDSFASARLIELDQLVQVDMRYGTTEAAEDDPPWAAPTTGSVNDPYTYRNGHSMWHKFTSTVTGTVTVTLDATLSTIKAITSPSDRQLGVTVWTGSVLGSLTAVAHYTPRSIGGTGTVSFTFSAVSGTDYYISTHAYSGSPPGATNDVFGGAFDLDTQGFGITTLKLTV